MKSLTVTLFTAFVSADADPVYPKCNTLEQTDRTNRDRVTDCSTTASCLKEN